MSVRIPVIVELGEGKVETLGVGTGHGVRQSMKPRELAQQMIGKGLRAQLAMQSFVTGQLMVTLDFYPDKPARLVGAEKEVSRDSHDTDHAPGTGGQVGENSYRGYHE